MKHAFFSGIVAMALAVMLMAGSPARAQSVVPGITEPSDRLELPFSNMGIIHGVHVKRGQFVEAGTRLMSQDTRLAEKELEILRVEADSTLRVDAAKSTLDAKQVHLERVQSLHSKGSAGELELRQAQLDVDLAGIEVRLAEQERQQAQLRADAAQIKLDLMHLVSPIAGYVEKLEVGLGEVVDGSMPAVVVVSNDPLWVRVHLPTQQAAKLQLGDKLQVSYGPDSEMIEATVDFLSPRAVSGGLREVRLEMSNPQNIESGRQVQVHLPAALAAAP